MIVQIHQIVTPGMSHLRKGYVCLRQEFKGELFVGVTGNWDICTRR